MENLTLVTPSPTAITISWSKPVACSEAYPVPSQDVSSYNIYYKRTDGTTFMKLNVPGSSVTRTTLRDGIEPAFKYEIQIAAVNRNGEGANSSALIVKSEQNGTYFFSILYRVIH